MANIFNDTMNKPLHTQRAFGWDRVTNTDANTGTNLSPTTGYQNGLLQTSTNITMKINGDVIGMVQSLSVSENRTINKLQAIGFEGIVQAVPGNTNAGQLSISRIALYNKRFADVVGINDSDIGIFATLRHQRVPFEISIETPTGTDGTAVTSLDVTTYYDCWIQSYSKSYTVQQITVAENLTVQYSDVL